MEYKDYYKILGLSRDSTQAEVKKAYRKLARQHHPDQNQGDKAAEERFKDLNEAHAVLSDPDKRKQYDTLGANWDAFARAGAGAGAGGPFGAGSPFGRGGVRYEFRSGDGSGFSDFFRTFFSGGAADPVSGRTGTAGRAGTRTSGGSATFEEILSQMGVDPGDLGTAGSGSTRRRSSARAPAAEAQAEMSLEEAFHGTSRIVEIDGKRLEVQIPRGVDNGSKIKLTGKGPGGRDLVVVVRMRPHSVFSRRGADLEREVQLSLEEALLGGEVPVTTLKGKVLLTVPPGTQNGRTFRLSGQGMPRFNADGTGDLYVRTRVVLPSDLSDEAREAARRFFELASQSDPRTAGVAGT